MRNGLSAKEFANFIAAERQEKITTTIGYQDKLESQVAPTTILTFCQKEILLRTLMGNDSFLRHGLDHTSPNQTDHGHGYSNIGDGDAV